MKTLELVIDEVITPCTNYKIPINLYIRHQNICLEHIQKVIDDTCGKTYDIEFIKCIIEQCKQQTIHQNVNALHTIIYSLNTEKTYINITFGKKSTQLVWKEIK